MESTSSSKPPLKNIRLTLSYHGKPFQGWQKVGVGKSIETTLQNALETILRHPVTLQAASRTDAGVHARAQIVNFFSPSINLQRCVYSLNRLLQKEICIHSAEEAPLEFHPTLDAKGKEYLYQICYGPIQLPFLQETSWHFPYPLDLLQMEQGAALLLGTHDFSALCNARVLWDRTPFCTLQSIQITPLAIDRLQIAIIGDRFLYKMMRNLAGTLAYIGCGKLQKDALPKILEGKDRALAGMTAPAHGLCLNRVFYANLP